VTGDSLVDFGNDPGHDAQRRSQGVTRVGKATPIPSKKKIKAIRTYSIYNVHIAH